MSDAGRGKASGARVAAVAAVAALALGVAGCGGAYSGTQQGASTHHAAFHKVAAQPDPSGRSLKLETRTIAGLGTIVTGPSGGTVYMFTKDEPARSTCSGPCVREWPPVTTVGEPRVGGGLNPSKLGYVEREGSALQVTYDGHPLYFYHEDGREEGESGGEGVTQFGGRWYALSPSGAPIKKHARHGGS
jgi:predicted lipoprotein with Yx(FWY)xxD motif